MRLPELMQSWVGKAVIAMLLFAAGYYFPLFGAPGTPAAPPATAASTPAGASAAR